MKGNWVLALTAGATLAIATPSAADAQSRSIRETWEQAARRNERGDDRDDARAERERARAQERDRLQERERERIRALERERGRMRERERELDRERERIRARERELELERARRAEAARERWERQRRIDAAERRRQEERERLRNQRDRDYDDDDYDDDDYRSRRSGNGNGPSYCRSGEGHPVYGREWCRQRGYDLGRGQGWERDRWGDIVFRGSNRRRDEHLGRTALAQLLGNTLLNRFESYGRQYGRGPVTGYWTPQSNGNVLQLSIGSIPIARLIDLNRDRRVDYLLLRR